MQLYNERREGEPDALELAHIISQSFSEGIKGVSEEARQNVGLLLKPSSIVNHTKVVSAFQSLTGQKPLGLSLNTLAGSQPAFYWVLETLITPGTLCCLHRLRTDISTASTFG